MWCRPRSATKAVSQRTPRTRRSARAHRSYRVALVAYDTAAISTLDILRIFWGTTIRPGLPAGQRCGNPIPLCDLLDDRRAAGDGREDTGRLPGGLTCQGRGRDHHGDRAAVRAPFYYAEDYHQRYLHKVPHGYRCHATRGRTAVIKRCPCHLIAQMTTQSAAGAQLPV